MVGQYLGDYRSHALPGRDVQEFIWPMGVRVRPEHAGHDKLSLRKFLAEHRHKRNAAALAHIGGRRSECGFRRAR